MFMTWFVASSRAEFQIKSDHFGVGVGYRIISGKSWPTFFPFSFFPLLLVFISPSPLASTDLQSCGAKGSGVDDVSRSRVVEGWWIPPTVIPSPVFLHLWYEGLRIWGRVVSSTRGLQAELPPLRETRRGSKIWYKRARARARERERPRDARTHASTHATAVHTHQGIPRKDRRRKKTRIEREYETHGEMKSIETAENCTNLAGRD